MPHQALGRHQLLSGTLRCAIRTKTVAAQDRPARRRFEGHGVVLAALIARDVESLTVTTCLSSSSTKVGPPRIAAWLTSFRMSQITFPVILLFAFSKSEGSVALRTRDFEVWHRGFSTRVDSRLSTLFFALRSAGVAFLSSTKLWSESAVSQTLRRKATRPDGLIAASVLQRLTLFNYFVWRNLFREFLMCGASATRPSLECLYTSLLLRHIGCSFIQRKHGSPDIRAPDF